MPADCSRAMAASGLSNRKIITAVPPRPKVKAYMYSMLMPVFSKIPKQLSQAAGPVGDFHRHHLRDVDDVACFLEEGAHLPSNPKR